MIKQIELKVFPDKVNDQTYLDALIKQQIKSNFLRISDKVLTRKSIDARWKRQFYILKYDIYIDETFV